ncbi:hypothetical protein B0T24DRAFT_675417 [Lasiosphaeria ovina]|uniref:C2H2-type domain-containing protein n=1 Tax=Lasiosphaeria ovina TaxID=92902 RepID=A0AAE0NDS9_9PEZI|nr:hypothetical protein B0T24DRAFT_675417 [Lasiosphaeria ovina]
MAPQKVTLDISPLSIQATMTSLTPNIRASLHCECPRCMYNTLPATRGADAAAKSGSSPAPGESRETFLDSDESDSASDTTSRTDSSLVETFRASTAPLTPQLLSVLTCMKEEVDDRIRSRLQSVVTHPQGARQCPPGSPSPSGFLPGVSVSAHFFGGYNGGPRQQPARGTGGEGHDSEADDSEDEDMNKQSELPLRDSSRGGLACVFFKRYPGNQNLSGACLGPGWHSVHRLKEHIYRVHRQTGSPCPRCREVFETSSHLNRHLQQNIPCELSASLDEEEMLFINYEQEKKLKKRIRKGAAEERWVGIFQVVFPDVPENEIPSPYYEAVTTLPSSDLTTLQDFQAHLLRTLPSRISRGVGGGLERGVTEVCYEAISEVFGEFMPMLQFTSQSSQNPSGTCTPDAASMIPPGPSEALSVSQRDTGFSPDPSLSHLSTPSSSAQPESSTFGVDSDLAQSSSDHWFMWNNAGCVLPGNPRAHLGQWQTLGASGEHVDAVVETPNASESSAPNGDWQAREYSSFWLPGG